MHPCVLLPVFPSTSVPSLQRPTTSTEEELDEEEDSQEEEKQPLAVIPYVSGVSERIRKACEKFNLKVGFKSGPTLQQQPQQGRGLRVTGLLDRDHEEVGGWGQLQPR